MPGTYTLKPIEAKLTHDTSLIGRMDPYCVVIAGNSKVQSQVCSKGGKHPHWSDALTISVTDDINPKAIVQIMDKDRILPDDNVGSCEMDLREVQSTGHISKWYPLTYGGNLAGEILLEATYEPGLTGTKGTMGKIGTTGMGTLVTEKQSTTLEHQEPPVVFTEQQQVVEPCTFTKQVESVEIRADTKRIEVMEPIKVTKEVPVTEPVSVTKVIEVTKPEVVTKEVEVMEPRLVTKTIQVVEDVPVKRQVEVVEMRSNYETVETVEPKTTMQKVEVTEYVPVEKNVTVTEPVTVKKNVEYVEPVITTKTVTKEIPEAVVVKQEITTTVGPATVVDVETERIRGSEKIMKENLWKEEIRRKDVTKVTERTDERVVEGEAGWNPDEVDVDKVELEKIWKGEQTKKTEHKPDFF